MKFNFYEWFTLFYPKLLNFIAEFTNIVFSLLKTLFNTIFIPVILIGVIIVEIPRVQSGIQIFDPNPDHAKIGAIVLVLLVLVLELLVQYLEQKDGYEKSKNYVFSIRTFLSRIRYFIGYGDDFEPKLKSPATRYKNVLALVRNGVIFLSVVGTMQFAIEAASESDLPWHQAIVEVFYNSDLQTITNWLVGLVFALIIVRSSTSLSSYIGIVAYDAQETLEQRQSVLLKNKSNRILPIDFLEQFKSVKLKNLIYNPNDYFIKTDDGKIRFYDGIRNRVTQEFSLADRLKFIATVERIIKEREN